MDGRKLHLRGYKFKDTKHDRFGKRSAATEAEEIDDRSTEADVNALRRSIEFFFLFSTSSSNNFRFAFLALKVASQAFTWKISICSAKINHVLRCSLSRELATGRAHLRTAVRGAALHLQLTEPKEQRVAQRGLCAQAWMSELKSSPGPSNLLDMRSSVIDVCAIFTNLLCWYFRLKLRSIERCSAVNVAEWVSSLFAYCLLHLARLMWAECEP